MAKYTVTGKFTELGSDGTENLETLEDFASTHAILEIITVGHDMDNIISVVSYQDDDIVRMYMVKHIYLEFADFNTERQLQAYKNMSNRVRREIGAYSNKYNTANW